MGKHNYQCRKAYIQRRKLKKTLSQKNDLKEVDKEVQKTVTGKGLEVFERVTEDEFEIWCMLLSIHSRVKEIVSRLHCNGLINRKCEMPCTNIDVF